MTEPVARNPPASTRVTTKHCALPRTSPLTSDDSILPAERRRCAENALRHADEDLSWKALAPRFSEVLEQVARRGAAKARS